MPINRLVDFVFAGHTADGTGLIVRKKRKSHKIA